MQTILRLDCAGRPIEWLRPEDAACYYATQSVAWYLGDPIVVLRGGYNRAAERSLLPIHPVIAVVGEDRGTARHTPRLDNPTLFARDQHLCLYCGRSFAPADLTRDHVLPYAQGGGDLWENVVAACRRCNHRKGPMTPDQAGMPLLAVPFRPNRAEWLALSGRRILADQMAFLRTHFSAHFRRSSMA